MVKLVEISVPILTLGEIYRIEKNVYECVATFSSSLFFLGIQRLISFKYRFIQIIFEREWLKKDPFSCAVCCVAFPRQSKPLHLWTLIMFDHPYLYVCVQTKQLDIYT